MALVLSGSGIVDGNISNVSASKLTGALSKSVLPNSSIAQVRTATYTGHSVVGNTYTGGHLFVDFAPLYADSHFLFIANCFFGYENHDLWADVGIDISGAAPGGNITPVGATGSGDNNYHISGIASTAGNSAIDDWSCATTPMHFYWEPPSNLGTSSRRFQVISRRRGNAGNIVWNRIWQTTTDSRGATTVSTLTVFELKG
jgi:hypothetical protein